MPVLPTVDTFLGRTAKRSTDRWMWRGTRNLTLVKTDKTLHRKEST